MKIRQYLNEDEEVYLKATSTGLARDMLHVQRFKRKEIGSKYE